VTNLPDLSNTKYKCLQKVASGGMGTIYLAEDTQLHRKIALKILDIPDPDGDLADRMQQEAYIIAALEHPSIVPIHDVGTLPDGRIFWIASLCSQRHVYFLDNPGLFTIYKIIQYPKSLLKLFKPFVN
ncbi:hypothetical protein IH799_06915, partial [candidate division KSB1 bacterium]|nr:hypothetical protein [candidate division KSB1 bacterium]